MEKPKLIQGGAQTNKVNSESKKVETPKVEVKEQINKSAEKIEPQGITQREAVYIAVTRVMREEKIVATENQAMKPLLNEAHIKKICTALAAGFQAKKIALKDSEGNKKKLADPKLMELYCLGLLNNWLKRDNRLNGTLNSSK